MNLPTAFTIFFLCLCPATFVFARPLQTRDVYAPPILFPAKGTVWRVGVNQTVTWDVSDPPQQITNPVGLITLRKGNKTLPITLASNFSITLGSIQVQVPSVQPAHDYRLVLFGDSGNWSPEFTITT